jgi:cathepsin F
MSLKLTFIVLLIAVVNSQAIDEEFKNFQKFITQFKKIYQDHSSLKNKFDVFKQNMNTAKYYFHNHNGTPTKFMDMAPEDFKKNYLNLNVEGMSSIYSKKSWMDAMIEKFHPNSTPSQNHHANIPAVDPKHNITPSPQPNPTPSPQPTPTPSPQISPTSTTRDLSNIPASWDWTEKGAVGIVKNQKSCGSCWSFATAGNIEGVYFLKYGKMIELSEQQLIDCDTSNNGCNGGAIQYGFDYIKNAGGAVSELDYPYEAVKNSCRVNISKAVTKIAGFMDAGTKDEEKIKQMLYTVGPLAIVINATPLQYYTSGIIDFTYAQCPSTGINHGVLLVGYGVLNGVPFWKVKNSWGQNWGEKGYFRVTRGSGTCGINSYALSAKLN